MTENTTGPMKVLLNPHEFAYYTGVTLRGFSISLKPEGWQVIFRGTKRNGADVYSLFVAVILEEAIQGLYGAVTSKGGERWWYPDKFSS